MAKTAMQKMLEKMLTVEANGRVNKSNVKQQTANFQILRVAKLTTAGAIGGAAEHAFRERDTPNADAAVTPFNKIEGASSSEAVKLAIDKRIAELDEVQPQSVRCVEYLITTSPEAMKGMCVGEDEVFFDTALDWVKRRHGAENVVASIVHRDETTPHMTVFVVPVVQREAHTRKRSVSTPGSGREVREFAVPAKSVLSAAHYFDGRKKLADMQTDFHEKVGKLFLLDRGVHRASGDERESHTSVKGWYAIMPMLLREIETLKANLEASRAILEEDRRQFEAEKAKGLKLLAGVRTGLDQREKDLRDREADLDLRKEKMDAEVKGKLAGLNAHIADFNEARAAFKKDRDSFQEVTKGYTPGQILEGIKSLEKAAVKPQGRGGGRVRA